MGWSQLYRELASPPIQESCTYMLRRSIRFIPHLASARVARARVATTRVPRFSRVASARVAPARVAPARVAPARVAPARVAPARVAPPGCPRVAPAFFHIFNPHFLSSNIPLRNSTNNKIAFFLSLLSASLLSHIQIMH